MGHQVTNMNIFFATCDFLVSCAVYSLERENGEVVGQLTVTIEAISLFRELMGHGQ